MFKNMKIGVRLGLGFGVLVALMILVGGLAILRIGAVRDDIHTVITDRMPKVKKANDWIDAVNAIARIMRNAILLNDVAAVERELARIPGEREKIDQARKYLEETILSQEGKELLKKAAELINPVRMAQEEIIALSRQNKDAEATAFLLGPYRELQNKYFEAIFALIDFQNKLADQDGHQAEILAEHTTTQVIGLLVTAVLIALLIAWWITRSITGPVTQAMRIADQVALGKTDVAIAVDSNDEVGALLQSLKRMVETINHLSRELGSLIEAAKAGQLSRRGDARAFQGDWAAMVNGVNQILDAILSPIQEAASVLDKVAARDLTARVVGDYKGDHAKIKNALNTAVENLDQALAQVAEGATQVASASQQISAGSQALAQGANEQASSLEEVSSSLEEMASMTKQNADNAAQAKNLAGEADANARQGKEAMARMSEAIQRIKEGSDATAKIVKTIDEIAMQTNLLALNAAVEAARAGEAGRGFAVVAEEVRNLAQRSAQAAKNTADMIGESVKNADDGVKIAQEVAKAFDLIATSAKKVNDLIAEIAAASKEQSQGIEQVNVAVSQMDKVTQQNAANSEESASASEELSSQAEELQSMVAQFKINAVVAARGPALTHHVTMSHKSALPPANKHKAVVPSKPGKISAEEVLPLDDEALKEF